MEKMIDPSNCFRYKLAEHIDTACKKIITYLSDGHPQIFLVHQDSRIVHNRSLNRLTLIHRHWGPTGNMEIIPSDITQTLILIAAPPDPGLEDVSSYETKILDNLPTSTAAIRLALIEGDNERAFTLMRKALREQRHHCWSHIHYGLIRTLRLEPVDGDHEGLFRDIPNDNREVHIPAQNEKVVLDLWMKGHTAKEIALRMGRTEKTILNRLTLLRKAYGEQMVPRRKLVRW